jgi:hypothetical protein
MNLKGKQMFFNSAFGKFYFTDAAVGTTLMPIKRERGLSLSKPLYRLANANGG